ncbi:MAG: hypothetical protein ACRDTJ_06795, partial [Pseudonocardiaceae bacterium]
MRTQDPGLVLCVDALKEAAALWHAAQPANAAKMTGVERQRASAAQHVLGWLYCTRYSSLPVDDGWADLAQALLLLTPFAQSAPETIPGPLHPMISASADPDIQAGIAAELLVHIQHHEDPAALAVAIDLHTRAIAATSIDHPKRAWWLSDLGIAYRVRFERTGAAADLDAAIDYSSQAVAATPTGHSDRAMLQRNLDIAHETRLERAYIPTDLDPAIESSWGPGVELDHSDRAEIAANLDEAIERSMEMLADRPASRGETLSKLAGTYLTLFERSGIAASLDVAIDVFTRALAASRGDDTHRHWHLSNLGYAYQTRFRRVGAAADLDVAIDLFTRALAANSVASPTRAQRLSQLCIAHHLHFESSGEAIDRDTLLELADQVRLLALVPLLYAHTAATVARLARAVGEHAVAVGLFQNAVQALPRVARHELERRGQEDRLGSYAGLMSEVVDAHLQVNDVTGAVEMAELGRGVLLSVQLDARTDLTELRRIWPDLAERFEALQDELTIAPLTRSGAEFSAETTAHLGRVRVTRGWLRDADWHGVMADIRELDGFEHFLAPPCWADLAPAASGGAV